MATIEDILKRYDEFSEKALSTEGVATAQADAAYRDVWGLLDNEERMYLSFARTEAQGSEDSELVKDFANIVSEVRARLTARLLNG